MSQLTVLINEIIICPECIKKFKVKRFPISEKGVKNLNIHLKMKHNAPYKLKGQLTYSSGLSSN